MPLPEQDYCDLPMLADRWKTNTTRVRHYAEVDRLRCSIWVRQIWVELGKLKRQPNGGKVFEATEQLFVEGLVGLMPDDCRLLFRDGCVTTDMFVSIKEPGRYIKIVDPKRKLIKVTLHDLVVRTVDRDHFEKKHKLGAYSHAYMSALHEEKEAYTDAPDVFSHSNNYRSVSIHGVVFRLGHTQSRMIKILHEAYLAGDPQVEGSTLLSDAGSGSDCVRSAFKSKKNWRKLIASDGRGYYRLNM